MSLVHYPVCSEEVEQAVDQRKGRDLVEVDPTRVGCIVAGCRFLAFGHRRGEVDDDEVMIRADALHPVERTVDLDIESGLLPYLSSCCIGHALPRLDSPARERPTPGLGRSGPTDQQHVVVVQDHRTNGELDSSGHVSRLR